MSAARGRRTPPELLPFPAWKRRRYERLGLPIPDPVVPPKLPRPRRNAPALEPDPEPEPEREKFGTRDWRRRRYERLGLPLPPPKPKKKRKARAKRRKPPKPAVAPKPAPPPLPGAPAGHEYLDIEGVAARAGIKLSSARVMRGDGRLPMPDVSWFGRDLWQVETIAHWRSQLRKRGRPRPVPRRLRPPPRQVEWEAPPPIVNGARAEPPSRGASRRYEARRKKKKQAARWETRTAEIAAAARGEGLYCTVADVEELLGWEGGELPWEREQLRRRLLELARTVP